jgi:hypothetical protein
MSIDERAGPLVARKWRRSIAHGQLSATMFATRDRRSAI